MSKPDGQVAVRPDAQRSVEEQPLRRVDGQADTGGFDLHAMTKRGERALQHMDSYIGAAAAANVERSGSEKANSHRATIIV